MALYRNIGNGELKRISRREMKQTIMRANNWNEEQYRKQYDIFKNKLRFYESVQKGRGVSITEQSPQELLYKAAKSKLRYGSAYEPSQEMAQIQSVTAHSITKGRRIAAAASGRSYQAAVRSIVNIRFGGFIGYYAKAQEIVERITDPVQQEAALKAFADYLHAKFPRSGKDKGGVTLGGEGGISYGETYGSGDADEGSDFDIEDWL